MNKKIFIVILVIVLLLVLCIGIALIFKTDKTEQVSDADIVEDNVTITNEQENTIVEVAISNVEIVTTKENTTLENNVSNSIGNNSTSSNNVTTNTTKASSNTTSSKTTNTTSSKTATNSSKNTTSGNSSNNSISSSNNTSSTTTKNNTTSTNESATTQNNTTSQTKVEEKEPEVIETYKVNNDIINKMKSIIENNPSELMLKNGFSVVVDSSIVNDTNQFTFTEIRVKNAIIHRFGTIKIYARDYYCNGEYVWTESFIL